MDLIIIALMGLAVYYKLYTLAVVLGGILVSAVGGLVEKDLRAETKKCNMITTDVVVGLLRKDIAEPEYLRKALEERGDLYSQGRTVAKLSAQELTPEEVEIISKRRIAAQEKFRRLI